MTLDKAFAALRLGRPALVYDDRDLSQGPVLVMPVGADLGWAIEADDAAGLDGVGVLTLALDASRLDRFVPGCLVSRTAPSRIGLKGDADARAIASAVLNPATPSEAFAVGGSLRLAPIRVGGVLAARSLEAGAYDLARLAVGSTAALLIAAPPEIERAREVTVSLTDIAAHRERTEVLIEEAASARLPSTYGGPGFLARAFVSVHDGMEHLALIKGEPEPGALVRIHSECLTGDALGSMRCDCGEQLRAAMVQIAAAPSGALIYVRGHEGRGIGLANKIRAYALQDIGLDTAEANAALGFPHDAREYAVAAQILKHLNLVDVRLLSNNPRKASALKSFGVIVREEAPLVLKANPFNLAYLNAKRYKLGHRLPEFDGSLDALVGQR
jgi:3,4-dihydroxy 2-butanone 4-phosphate synthase/GTP cyclohydrolase II